MTMDQPKPAPPDALQDAAHTITVIGLGALGLALGRALRALRTSYRVLGHDREPERGRAAMAAGAIDRAVWTLPAAVEEADLVFLCEPVDQTLETLTWIAPHLKPEAMVTDTAPLKAPVLERAAQVLPAGVSYVGGHPILAGARHAAAESDPLAAFRGVAWCLCAPPRAHPQAVATLERLLAALQARPFYIDAAEHDALSGGALLLPLLGELALLGALDQSPSVDDLRRLGAPAFLARIGAAEDLGAAVAPLARVEPAALLRWLDSQLAALTALRGALAAGGEAWQAWLDGATARAAAWERPADRRDAFDQALSDAPRSLDLGRRLFGRWGRPRPPEPPGERITPS